MKTRSLGIILNGVTGRMGTNQHLVRSLVAIRQQGGIRVSDNEVILPQPVLLGRNQNKLRAISAAHGGFPFSTDMDALLSDPELQIYFDAQTTVRRVEAVKKAIAAGKHIYVEKPTATNSKEALEIYNLAEKAGLKNGVVQDKLWLPGLRKLKYLIDTGFFGEILAVRGEFGYWVFPGEHQPSQRPSWNYRSAEGGGIILDMLAHWRYVIDHLFGNITSLTCLGAIHVKNRWDERGRPYTCDVEDAAYATFLTERGIVCQFNSSWQTRLRRDDLLTIHVDGMRGSAVAGLRECVTQPDANTPKPVWNPDIPATIDYFGNWTTMPTNIVYDNAFKAEWELFLRHVALNEPFQWTLKEGAKGVQLAELAHESWRRRCWVDVVELA